MDLDKDLLKKIIAEPILTRNLISEKYAISEQAARHYIFVAENFDAISELFETDEELVEASVRYKKQQQKFMDINRVERKSFREYARVENAVSEYVKNLIAVFENNQYQPIGKTHLSKDHAVGVIQLSDLHFNELIDIKSNKYDFNIASKRIHKLVSEARRYFLLHDISDVFVFLSGDLMNSDRRLDEIMALATNRSKATFISAQILENALVDLNSSFNIYVAGVVGNESRVGKDYNWQNDMVSDNYDFVIFNVLRYKLKNVSGITFLGLSDKHEEVVQVNNKNFLIIHGHQIGKDMSKDISKLIRKYAQMDIDVDYVIFGHLHESLLSDTYARSSSLCGSNSYSEDALLLVGRASQNLYLVFNRDRIDCIRVDLQDTESYSGYDTFDWKDAYNPKSVDKARKHETVLKIII